MRASTMTTFLHRLNHNAPNAANRAGVQHVSIRLRGHVPCVRSGPSRRMRHSMPSSCRAPSFLPYQLEARSWYGPTATCRSWSIPRTPQRERSAALVVGYVQDVVAVCDCAGRRFDDQARERHHERVHRLQSEWPRLGHLVDLLSRAMHREGTTWIVLQGRRLCHGWRFLNS